MSLLRNILIGSIVLFPGASFAQQIVATGVESVANYFLDEGAEATVEEDSVGDPKVQVTHYGVEFSIYYYGCEDGINCDAIQFFSGYRTEGGIRKAKANEWNENNRFASAYITESGSTRIEYDVYLGKVGMDPDDFAKLVGKWVSSQKEFETFIDW